MKGTRPLDNDEIRLVSACFDGTFEARNRGLFLLGVSTGGRISELLSLQIGDVYQNHRAVTDLLYDRSIVKGGEVSRAVPVNTDGRRAIDELVRWHREQYRTVNASRPLFPSRNGKGKQRMTRRAAHNVLKSAFMTAGLNGHLATHSLRKSFAQRFYEQTGDVFTVQEMLGHRSIAQTQECLDVNYVNVRKAEESRAKSFSKHLFVYFIQGEKTHLIKIGQTRNNPYKRLDALQSYSPDKLRLLKVIYAEADYEHQLHKRFASNRVHGEWFYPSQRLLKLIENLEGITDFREPDDPQARTPQLPKRNLT